MTGAPATTFVTCIEPGALEPMTLRLLESIRRHGGRFADSRFIACQPRLGPPLSEQTRDRLREMGGEHVWLYQPRRFDWYHYLNKAESLLRLNDRIQTDWVTFLDSDMLVAREPNEFVADDVDFIACAPDTGLVGSTGASDPMDPAWLRYIEAVGLRPDAVPMIREYNTGTLIRFYFNSGAFSYRKSTNFALTYWNTVRDALKKNLGFPRYGEHYTDQVVLGLCALKMNLRWRELPMEYNLAVDRDAGQLPDEQLRSAILLHYHKALERDPKALFDRLWKTHPALADWLAPLGPLEDPRNSLAKVSCEALRITRGVPRAIYRRRVALEFGEAR